MRYLSLAAIVLASTGQIFAAENPAAPTSARVRCVVAPAEHVDLSPREPGILKDDPVKPGTRVDVGQLVLQLDDTKAQQELNVAKAKFNAADIKAKDDVNILYSEAANRVAQKEFVYNTQANQKVPGSVPKAKMDELELKCDETRLAITKAKHDKAVAEAEAGIADAEVKAAETMIELLKVKSPIDGEVVEVHKHKGEAVQPGESGVIRIVNLDKLWVEGPVEAAKFSREQLDNQPVSIEIPGAGTAKITVPGKVIFVSPEAESGDTSYGSYTVRAEVQRERRDVPLPLHSGMRVEMVIQLKQ
jgi:multidrug efflux pump subunit AcrA (membrane-fusion protein)